ncbi:Diacylglycerol O-acyltransferase 2, partial [Cladochytrium tenue]
MAPLLRIAPLNTPLRRRRQTFAVLLWILFVPLSLLLFGVLLLQPTTAPLALAYLIFIFVDAAHETGGRPSRAFRRLALWRWLRDFFPAAVVKTTDLDPAGNYVFLYHPHGIISLGAFINFGTDAAGFAKLFPGVDVRLLTLEPNFRVPFFREILLFLGICSVSRQSCQN